MKGKKVLLTGSSSFTGKYVIKELKSRGYTLYESVDKGVDLRDFDGVSELVNKIQPHYVIHLAALSFVGHSNVNEIYETNLLGTLNLLKVLEESKLSLQKIILASTANIYGSVEAKINEEYPPNPANHYGISKFAMELAAQQWFGKLPLIISRPFNYTGVGQAEHFLVPKIVKHFKDKKQFIELGNLDIYRDFSDVRDVAKWYVNLLDSNRENLCVNLCSGVLTSIGDIINELNMLAGYEISVKVNPDFVRENEIKRLCGDDNLLTSIIDIDDRTSIKETLAWMYTSN